MRKIVLCISGAKNSVSFRKSNKDSELETVLRVNLKQYWEFTLRRNSIFF